MPPSTEQFFVMAFKNCPKMIENYLLRQWLLDLINHLYLIKIEISWNTLEPATTFQSTEFIIFHLLLSCDAQHLHPMLSHVHLLHAALELSHRLLPTFEHTKRKLKP